MCQRYNSLTPLTFGKLLNVIPPIADNACAAGQCPPVVALALQWKSRNPSSSHNVYEARRYSILTRHFKGFRNYGQYYTPIALPSAELIKNFVNNDVVPSVALGAKKRGRARILTLLLLLKQSDPPPSPDASDEQAKTSSAQGTLWATSCQLHRSYSARRHRSLHVPFLWIPALRRPCLFPSRRQI